MPFDSPRHAYPQSYTYSTSSPADDGLLDVPGCNCLPASGGTLTCPCSCPCGALGPAAVFAAAQAACADSGDRGLAACLRALMQQHTNGSTALPAFWITECGPACSCPAGGSCRLTQAGLRLSLQLQWDPRKGWCVLSRQHIPIGTFVCEYGGEALSTPEAAARLEKYDQLGTRHALLVLREHLPLRKPLALRINIDATQKGNVARFINHSCDGGNLQPVVVRRRGALLPAVALIARRHVHPGEEFTFSYDGSLCARPPSQQQAAAGSTSMLALESRQHEHVVRSSSQQHTARRPCACGTKACLGYLPNTPV